MKFRQILPWICCAGFAVAQQSPDYAHLSLPFNGTAEEVAARVNTVATIHAGWGLPLFPGSGLEVREEKRDQVNGATTITLRFFAKGYPQKQRFSLDTWEVGGEFVPLARNLVLDKDGMVLCDEKSVGVCNKSGPVEVPVQSARGEPERFVIISQDKKWRASGLLTPFPAVGMDGSCRIEMTRLAENSEAIFIRGTGFAANAEIQLRGDSAGEVQVRTRKTNAAGQFLYVDMPYVTGKEAGMDTVSVAGGTTCRPSVSLQWGKGTYHPE
jgi:hypothetical protein